VPVGDVGKRTNHAYGSSCGISHYVAACKNMSVCTVAAAKAILFRPELAAACYELSNALLTRSSSSG
jgi:hypothetical protein